LESLASRGKKRLGEKTTTGENVVRRQKNGKKGEPQEMPGSVRTIWPKEEVKVQEPRGEIPEKERFVLTKEPKVCKGGRTTPILTGEGTRLGGGIRNQGRLKRRKKKLGLKTGKPALGKKEVR